MRNESHFFLSLYQRSHVNRGSTVSTLASPLLKADSSFLISRASLLPFSRLECRKYETIIPGTILAGRLTWVSKMLKIKVLKNRTFRVFSSSETTKRSIGESVSKNCVRYKWLLVYYRYVTLFYQTRIFVSCDDDSSWFVVIWIDLYFFLPFFFVERRSVSMFAFLRSIECLNKQGQDPKVETIILPFFFVFFSSIRTISLSEDSINTTEFRLEMLKSIRCEEIYLYISIYIRKFVEILI